MRIRILDYVIGNATVTRNCILICRVPDVIRGSLSGLPLLCTEYIMEKLFQIAGYALGAYIGYQLFQLAQLAVSSGY